MIWNIRWRRDRLTLDMGDDGKRLLPEDQILMEVKIRRSLPSVAVPGAFRSVYLSRLVFEIRRLLQRDVPGGQCPRADE